MNRLFLNNR